MKHEQLWSNAAGAERLITFRWSKDRSTDWNEVFSDPAQSLEFSLSSLKKAIEIGDDSIPMIRVEVGTGLPASAFGAQVNVDAKNGPAVRTHPVTTPEKLKAVSNPDPEESGLFVHIYRQIEYFRQNMPQCVRLSQCDMQGPWNTAHLIAGDKILLDIYDNPGFVCGLLDEVTDFMIRVIPQMKKAIGEEWNSFYLDGTRIPGASRLCNCSTDMLAPGTYERLVLERDNRFFEAMNGGMMHFCGNNRRLIEHYNKIEKLRGFDMNFNNMDVFEAADLLREDIVLICSGSVEYPLLTPLGADTLQKFYRGEFPDKRNILFRFLDPINAEKCERLMDAVYGGNTQAK